METLKNKFSKGLTTINVKTNNFMEQNKIHTHISTIESEINSLKIQLAEIVYTRWANGEFDISNVEDILNRIKGRYEDIDIQKEKIEQILFEERQILGTMQEQKMSKEALIYCSNCGAASAANYKFCSKCGSLL